MRKRDRKKYAPKASPAEIDEESREVAREIGIEVDESRAQASDVPEAPPPGGVEDAQVIAEDDDEDLEVDIVDGDARPEARGQDIDPFAHSSLRESVLRIMCPRQNEAQQDPAESFQTLS